MLTLLPAEPWHLQQKQRSSIIDTRLCFVNNGSCTNTERASLASKKLFAAKVSSIVTDLSRDSRLFDPSIECEVPRFDRSEVHLGRMIGRGGYCTVHEVSLVDINSSSDNTYHFRYLLRQNEARRSGFTSDGTSHESNEDLMDWDEEHIQDQVRNRKLIANQCSDTKYALKIVDPSLAVSDPRKFCDSVVDLAVETRFLSVLNHPNIITMRAISLGDPFMEGHFIVLDRLHETLVERLEDWTKFNKICTPRFRRTKMETKDEFLVDRLSVAYDIASAMKYLHSLNVVYRDLKPDNIGFDVNGQAKIFDFGLATELRHEDMLENDVYQLSGGAGNTRYMAPEVALCKPYNHSVDVYSFGILLWEICALKLPFAKFNMNMAFYQSKVVDKGYRPKPHRAWPEELISLMENCWGEDFTTRTSFENVSETLFRLKQ